MNSSWKQLRTDRRGGIEGLPLQLMIVILVATMGTAVIIGWMGNIEEPHAISEVVVDEDCVTAKSGSTIETIGITVYDQNKDPLKGAVVLLSGLGVNGTDNDSSAPYKITDDNGKVSFSNINVNFPGKTGFLNISVSKSGYTENNSAQIMVIKG